MTLVPRSVFLDNPVAFISFTAIMAIATHAYNLITLRKQSLLGVSVGVIVCLLSLSSFDCHISSGSLLVLVAILQIAFLQAVTDRSWSGLRVISSLFSDIW